MRPLPGAAYRLWLDQVANGVRSFDTAPSDVLLGPPAPAPAPLPPPAPAAGPQRQWRPLGPFTIPHGQTKGGFTDARPLVAGRVSAIAVDPSDATHVLAGAAGGGVWESRNSGATWTPRTDDRESLAIGAIAFDPTTPATVYAGTGEGNALPYLGAGVLRSADGGRTWARPAPNPQMIGSGFFDLAIDPENPQHLVAGMTNGLWESTDGATTWTRVRPQTTWSVSIHPAVAGTPGASQEIFAACTDGLQLRSAAAGIFAPVALPGTAVGGWIRLCVAHAPSAPDVVWVFGAGPSGLPAGQPQTDNGHLLRRAVAGSAFTATPSGLTVATTQQAFYDWVLAVAPDNADLVWLGTTDVWTATRTAATGAVAFTLQSPRATGSAVHPDQHAFAFAPGAPATLYVGNDGGVYRTPDRGATWEPLNRGLAITEFEYLAQHPQVDAWLLGGTQDNGTERYEGSGTWFHVSDGDGGDCAVNEDAPATVFHERFSRGNAVIHNLRSRSGGGWDTWTYTPVAPVNHPTLFYAPMEVRGAMIVQAGQDVFVSDAEGDPGTFARVPIPPPVPAPANPDIVSAIAIVDADRIVVGTRMGRLFALARHAAGPPAWTVTALGALPSPAFVTDLLAAPDDPRRLWVACSGAPAPNVARSDDGGATAFAAAVGGLPAGLQVWAICADPANPPTVFVGTDRGVFRSTDKGATWTPIGAGLPNCQVKDLGFHPAARVLRAGTKSRGVWELEVDLAPSAAPDVVVRAHLVDSGRALPAGTLAPVETPDPFAPPGAARWWESPDVKVDAAPHLAPALAALEVDVFADDHGVAAAGLFDEAPAPGAAARVYVQAHNRSAVDAADVDVRVFFAGASIGAPPLPTDFWTGWPANAPGPGSAWQPVAGAVRVAAIEAGRSRLAAFDWAVPADLPGGAVFLAVAVPSGIAFAPAPTTVSELLAATNAAGVSSRIAVRPGPGVAGRRPGAVRADVRASADAGTYSLEIDAVSAPMVVGAVLSTALSNLAGGEGSVALVEADHPALGELLAADATLGGQLDRTKLYVPPSRGTWLSSLTLADGDSEPVVLLIVRPQPPRGRWCVVQRDAAGVVRGGLTLVA